MNLNQLISGIAELQTFTQTQAAKQVNQFLTMRNWLIGYYLVEYEQEGNDKAEYGDLLIVTIAKRLKNIGIKGMGISNIKSFRQFYLNYLQIGQTLSDQITKYPFPPLILQSLVTNSSQSTLAFQKSQTLSGQSVAPPILLSHCSWSHFLEFIRIDDPLKRTFYEVQTVNQAWSVRQLRRANDSMLYERTGLSLDMEGVITSFDAGTDMSPQELVRDPYILEFLNLTESPQYSESDLEQAIIDNLQDFLLEMGEGFCFEARQRRITFGNTHYHIDLVFYHRLLKCHVLIDLKIGTFNHADSGQMNVYLNYYKDKVQAAGDNPPIGIILCADKDNSLVQYATGGMEQQLFVSQYLINLPTEAALIALLERQQNIE